MLSVTESGVLQSVLSRKQILGTRNERGVGSFHALYLWGPGFKSGTREWLSYSDHRGKCRCNGRVKSCPCAELIKHYVMQTYRCGCGCIDQRIFDLGTSCRSMVSITSRPIYYRGKSPPYPLDRRLGGPQNRYGWHGEEKNIAHTRTRTPTPQTSRR
jgi:hypothetical protein